MNARTLLSVALAAACSLFSTALFADVTYYVAKGGDGSDPTSGDLTKAYAHPQTAVDAADGTTPTTILINDGTYALPSSTVATSVVTIAKGNITLRAINPRKAIMNGGTACKKDYERAITVGSGLSNVLIDGLVFTNGCNASSYKVASTATLDSGVVTNCAFHGYYLKRAAMIRLAGTAEFYSCLFAPSAEKLTPNDLGHRQITISGSVKMTDCEIRNLKTINTTSGYPITIDGLGVVLTRCVVSGITSGCPDADHDGVGNLEGIITMSAGTLDSCVITNNFVYGYGGGVYVSAKSVVIRNCTLWDNRATRAGNDLYVKSGVTPTITGTTASDLTPDANGNTNFDPTSDFCTSDSVAVGKAPFKVKFRNKTGVSATWDFGDGSASETGATPEHQYATAGKYTVTMTIGGQTVTRKDYIIATPAKMYVSTTGSGTKPYDTPGKAARHPQDAIDLAPDGAGTEIEVDDGTYTARNVNTDPTVLLINKSGIRLHSKNGRAVTKINAGTSLGTGSNVRRQMTIAKGLSDVEVRGLSLLNGIMGQYAGLSPVATYAGSGVLADCDISIYYMARNYGVCFYGDSIVTNCTVFRASPCSTSACQGSDIGVVISGNALVTHSVFQNWDMDFDYAQYMIRINSSTATLRNCLVRNVKTGKNSGTKGRGAVCLGEGTMENCTVTDCTNRGGYGGGVTIGSASAVFRNNIVWGNTASSGNNDIYTESLGYGMCVYSCASDLTSGINNNVGGDPQFNAGTLVPSKASLCTGAALVDHDWMDDAADLAGSPRLYSGTVSMGAYEPQERQTGLKGDISIVGKAYGKVPLSVSFSSDVKGGTGGYVYHWDFGDGTTVSGTDKDAPTHEYTTNGLYTVSLSVTYNSQTYPIATKEDAIATHSGICYVKEGSTGKAPYVSWESAAASIEDAFALQPDEIVVTNGTYAVLAAAGLNMKDFACYIHSVEGPEKTTLWTGKKTSIDRDARHYVAQLQRTDAILEGFSIRWGSQTILTASAGEVRNCIVTNQVDFNRCVMCSFSGAARVTDTLFDGTGASVHDHVTGEGTLLNLSGTAVADRCQVRNMYYSYVTTEGSATVAPVKINGSAVLRNSLVSRNDVRVHEQNKNSGAAGVLSISSTARIENCTVISNSFNFNTGIAIRGGSVINTLVFGNTSRDDGSKLGVTSVSAFENCALESGLALPACAVESLNVADPQFVDDGAGYRITKDSPCCNAGKNLGWCRRKGLAKDLDGQERHCNRPDIGCFEVQRELGLQLIVR